MTVRAFPIVPALVLMVCNFPAAARQGTGPEAFLRRIYAPYIAGDTTIDSMGKIAPMIFDARLTALIRKDEAQPQGEIGALDSDPICDCQDFDRIKLRSIRFLRRTSNKATAKVRFTNLRTTSVLKYTLTKSMRGWRVTDIGYSDMPSLVAFLQAGNNRR